MKKSSNFSGEDDRLLKTLERDTTNNYEEGLKEIYKKLRPGEPPTVESAKSLLDSLFFDPKRYDLAKVGRYKYNKKLGLSNRITGCRAVEDIVDPNTGELLVEADQIISRDTAVQIENAGIVFVWVYDMHDTGKKVKVIGNNFVDIGAYVEYDLSDTKVANKVFYPALMKLLRENEGVSESELKRILLKNVMSFLQNIY